MSASKQPQPLVKAFLICDQIIHDAQTGKKSLIGVFHELRADRFPALHPALWIYANITDARGNYDFEIRMVEVGRNDVMGSGRPPPIDISGPLQTTELSAQLRNVALPRAGTYEFHLSANGELIATKAISVMQVKPEGGTPETPPSA